MTKYTPTAQDLELIDPEVLRRGMVAQEREMARRVQAGVLAGEPAAILLNEVRRSMSQGLSGTAAWRRVLGRPRRPELAAAEINAAARGKALNKGLQLFADAPGGGGGVPTNGSYEHTHEHWSDEDGLTHSHNHWHYAGTTVHANGTTVAHDHDHGEGSPAEGANDRYEAGRGQRGDPPKPGSVVSSVTAAPVKSAEFELVNSPSRSQSSVAPISPRRQPAPDVDSSRKPTETREEYYARLRAQVASRAAGQVADVGGDVDLSEKTEAGYAKLKASELNSTPAKVREIAHHATTAGSVNLAESTTLRSKAFDRMKARGESVNPSSKSFSERYRRALLEVKPK